MHAKLPTPRGFSYEKRKPKVKDQFNIGPLVQQVEYNPAPPEQEPEKRE